MPLLQKGYLGSTPLFKETDWFEDGAAKINDVSSNVTVTANSSAHTKGAWTQLIASTSADSSFVYFVVSGVSASATDTATLLDIGKGAGGSETAIASNIAIGGASSVFVSFPCKIPSGTRIAARIQSVVTGGKTASVQFAAMDAGNYSTAPSTVDVIGTDTTTSKGTSFSGSSGSWVEATSSTSQAYRAVALILSCHDAAIVGSTSNYDIGVGASSSEILFGGARYQFTTAEACLATVPNTHLFGRKIASGSRLAVKHPIAADPGKYGFCIIGIP